VVAGEFWDLIPVDASRGDGWAAIGKGGNGLLFGHEKTSCG
jgi:hypothetical protein